MIHSEQINELAAALAKAQGAMQSAKKSSTNPHYRSRYADLAAIQEAARKPLADNGLAVFMSLDAEGKRLVAKLVHSSGQWMQSEHPIRPSKNDVQALGSAITYARRYTFATITGIVSEDEDDDGNAALTDDQRQRTQHSTVVPGKIADVLRTIEDADSLEALDGHCVAVIKAARLGAAEHETVTKAYRARRHLLRQAAGQKPRGVASLVQRREQAAASAPEPEPAQQEVAE